MIIDVNVNLSRWPTRRLPCDETPHLVARLRERGIAQAWAGSFDGLLYKDLAAVNVDIDTVNDLAPAIFLESLDHQIFHGQQARG